MVDTERIVISTRIYGDGKHHILDLYKTNVDSYEWYDNHGNTWFHCDYESAWLSDDNYPGSGVLDRVTFIPDNWDDLRVLLACETTWSNEDIDLCICMYNHFRTVRYELCNALVAINRVYYSKYMSEHGDSNERDRDVYVFDDDSCMEVRYAEVSDDAMQRICNYCDQLRREVGDEYVIGYVAVETAHDPDYKVLLNHKRMYHITTDRDKLKASEVVSALIYHAGGEMSFRRFIVEIGDGTYSYTFGNTEYTLTVTNNSESIGEGQIAYAYRVRITGVDMNIAVDLRYY